MERIKGNAVDQEFDRLIQEKKWLKVQIPHKEYERISIILQKRSFNATDFFQVDTPLDLKEVLLLSNKVMKIIFEFRGSDNVRYQFESKNWRLLDGQLWVLKPESMNRIQNRNNFRIKAPIGAKLVLPYDDHKLQLRLENISIGGAFASIRTKSLQLAQIEKPDIGRQCLGLELVFPAEILGESITIPQAQIIRIEKGYQKNRNGYAFHFIEISSDPKSLLTRVIYQLQRRFLQERIKE